MSGIGAILVSLTATLVAGGATCFVFGMASQRSAEVAAALGADGGERAGALRRLAARIDRLPVQNSFRRRLAGAGIQWSSTIVQSVIALFSIITFLGARYIVGYIAGGVIALAVPVAFNMWLKRKILRRAEMFIAQLPELSRFLSNGTSAGLSVERSLALAAKELPEPSHTEINDVVARLKLGWSLDGALQELSARLPSRELNVLVRTIVIQSRSGGALVAALQDIAIALEDRKQLHRQVRTAVLGTAFGAYIVPCIGAASVILLNMMRPGVLDDMATSLIGQIILVVSAVFFVIGVLLMRLVSRVEV